MTVSVNRASGQLQPPVPSTPPGAPLPAPVAAAPLNWGTAVPTAGLTLSAAGTSVSGTFALSLAGGTIAGTATVTATSTTLDLPGLPGARLITASVTGASLSLGGIATITSGPSGVLKIAVLRPAAADGDDREWVGLSGSGLGGSLTVPGVSLTPSAIAISINRASGAVGTTLATPRDWRDVPGSGLTLHGDLNAISGTVSDLNVAGGLLTGAATFALATRTVEIAGAPARLTTLTLSAFNLNLASGLATISSGSTGFLTVASLKATTTGDTREWLGVQGEDLGGTLTTPAATVTGLSLAINRAEGASATTAAAPLTWLTDLPEAGLSIEGDATTIAGRLASLSLADGLITGAATVLWTHEAVSVKPGSAPAAAGTLTRLALSELALSVGDAGFGLTLAPGGTLDVVIVSSGTDRWTGAVGQGLGGTLALGELATVTVPSLSLVLNQASAGAPDLDFTGAIDLDGGLGSAFAADAIDAAGPDPFDPAPGTRSPPTASPSRCSAACSPAAATSR